MSKRHKKIPTKRKLAKGCRQSFEDFVEAHNAENAEKQARQEEDEAFAEKYLSAMRRKLGMDGGAHEH